MRFDCLQSNSILVWGPRHRIVPKDTFDVTPGPCYKIFDAWAIFLRVLGNRKMILHSWIGLRNFLRCDFVTHVCDLENRKKLGG